MISFEIITIFPEIFSSFLKESLIARAQKKKLIKIRVHNLRRWTADRHRTVDDRPYGGGLGMVMKVEPIYKAVMEIKKKNAPHRRIRRGGEKAKIILFTPRGKKFNQKMAHQFSKLEHLILISGRYEGVDERVAKYITDEEISIGNYVLMGGELPAMVLIETVARLIPGVLGNPQLLKERIPALPGRGGRGFTEYVQYTRPEVFFPRKGVKWQAPKVLLSGDHKKIEIWRKKHSKIIEK